jgi:hypothetical protein
MFIVSDTPCSAFHYACCKKATDFFNKQDLNEQRAHATVTSEKAKPPVLIYYLKNTGRLQEVKIGTTRYYKTAFTVSTQWLLVSQTMQSGLFGFRIALILKQ